MAYEIGPRIGIKGEAEYRSQINGIITQTKTLHAEMRAMESGWTKETSARQKAADKSKLLTSAIDAQRSKLEKCNEMLAASSAKFGENNEKTMKWRQAVANATTELNRLEAELRVVPNQVQALGQDMQATGAKIQTAGQKMSSVGKGMSVALTLPIVGLGIAAVKTTAEFDTSMSKVAAVSGATGSELDALRDKAREMGKNTKFSASEAADAMNYMAMAGWKTEDMLNGVEGIMNLAAASGADLATTSDIVTDALTAFGRSAEDSGRLADIMAAASSNANTNVEMMGETFKYAAPVAGALGFSMEDTAIAIGLMANAGIKSSQAGTALRTGLTNLVKPTKQMQTAMEKYGIEITNSDGSMKSLREIVMELRKKLGGLGEAEQAAAAGAIFGKNAMSGWLAVINGADADVEKLSGAIDNSAGTAEAMAKTMQDNLAGQVTILKSQLEELGISFGEMLVPNIRKAVTWVQGMIDKFNNLDSGTKEMIVKIGGFIAALGPVLAIGGKITETYGKLHSGVGKIVEGVGTLQRKFAEKAIAMTADTVATEAQTVATGAATVAQTALNTAMMAMPLIALGVGIAAVTVGMVKYAKSVMEANKESIDASKEMQDVAESSRNLRAGLDEVSGASELDGQRVDNLTERLQELQSKTSLTADEQREMRAVVGQLNSTIPGLNATIDEQTGKLSGNTTEIYNNISAWRESFDVQVKQKQLEKLADDLAEAQNNLIRSEQEVKKWTDEVGASAGNVKTDINGAALATDAATMSHYSNVSALQSAQTAYDESQLAVTELEAAYTEIADSIDTTGTQATETAGEMTDLGCSVDENGQIILDTDSEIVTANEEVAVSYDQLYQEALESVTGQGNLFEELKSDSEITLSSMSAALQSQATAYGNYANNVDTVMNDTRYKTDENFRAMADSIMAMGIDGADYLQQFTTAAQGEGDELTNILTDFGHAQQAKEAYAAAMAGMQIATAEATGAAVAGVEAAGPQIQTAAEAAGDAYPQGIAQGAAGAEGAVDQAVSGAAGAFDGGQAQAAAGGSALMKSYSGAINTGVNSIKATAPTVRAAGQQLGTALSAGITSGTSTVRGAVNRLGNTVKSLPQTVRSNSSSARSAGAALGVALSSGLSTGAGSVRYAANSLGDSVRSLITKANGYKSEASQAGRGISNGLATGLNNGKGNVSNSASGLANAARTPLQNIASNATQWGNHMGQNFARGIAAARASAIAEANATAAAVARILKHTTPEAGPLKDDDQWGIHLGENFAEGIAKTSGLAYDAALGTAKNTAAGITGGIASNQKAITAAGASIGVAVESGINEELGIHSPSKSMEKTASNIIAGLVKGIKKSNKKAKKANKKSAKELLAVYVEEGEKRLTLMEAQNKSSEELEVSFWQTMMKKVRKNKSARYNAELKYYTAVNALAKKNADAEEERQKALEERARKEEEANDAARTSAEKLTQDYIKNVTALKEAYAEAVESRKNLILGTWSIYEAASFNDAPADLVEDLRGQVDAFKRYEKTLDSLREKLGETSDVYKELAAGDVKDLLRLEQIDSMSASELRQFVSVYNERTKIAQRQAEKENASLLKSTNAQVKSLTTAYTNALRNAQKSLKSAGVSSGKSIVEGISSGITTGMENLNKTFSAQALKLVSGVKTALKIKSPSRVFRDEVGEMIPAGMAEGIVAAIPVVRAASAQMTAAAITAANPAYDPAVVSGRSMFGESIAQGIGLSAAGVDPEAIYAAVRQGASNAEVKLYIGDRELGRVLRDMGVVFAA